MRSASCGRGLRVELRQLCGVALVCEAQAHKPRNARTRSVSIVDTNAPARRSVTSVYLYRLSRHCTPGALGATEDATAFVRPRNLLQVCLAPLLAGFRYPGRLLRGAPRHAVALQRSRRVSAHAEPLAGSDGSGAPGGGLSRKYASQIAPSASRATRT